MRRAAAVGILLLTTSCISIPLGPRTDGSASAPAGGASASDAQATPAPPPPANYVLILDSSGSMKTADMSGGQDRMTAARDAGRRFVEALPGDAKVALVTYGDQTPEDAPKASGCGDVTVKIPLGTARSGVGPTLDQLRPTGWTPISLALTKAAEQAPAGETASIVLVSDGEDSCAPPNPCDTAAEIVRGKPNLTISTLGVRASSEQLACIADRGNGLSLPADNAAQLARRLPALSNPAAAADMLSPQGVQKVRPGTEYARIREQHPDFPDLPAAVATVVKVIWRNCEWRFDDKQVLREIVLQGGPTIDGIKAGDPVGAVEVLGTRVKTEPAAPDAGAPAGAETRYYAADERLGLAWKVTVADGKIITIVLCTCLPVTPCPPSDSDVRALQGDPSMQIKDRKCTNDKQWAAISADFEGGNRSGWLVLRRSGATWQKVIRITHGGDCFSIPADAPRELNAMIDNGQWCTAAFTVNELQNATITTDGLGPIKLGMTGKELEDMGLVRPLDVCSGWQPTEIVPKDVWFDLYDNGRLNAIWIANPAFKTRSGVRVGTSVAEVERVYAGKLESYSVQMEGGVRYSRAVVSGRNAVAFDVGNQKGARTTVTAIAVEYRDKPAVGGC